MSPRTLAAINIALAAVFFFVLQRFGLNASLETALMWAAAGAGGAAWLSWKQLRG